MEVTSAFEERSSSMCSLSYFDCLVHKTKVNDAWKPASGQIRVEREVRVYNQPHLVEPMKLTVYDDLPATPLPGQTSNFTNWMSQSRDVMSRASTRASFSTRRKINKKSIVVKPQPLLSFENSFPQRRSSFRFLQLSIYESTKRLSDLPSFDRLSFTEYGDIRAPPPALVRTQSDDLLRVRSNETVPEMPTKPTSMYANPPPRTYLRSRGNTVSSSIYSSRPASECDGLRSHPISWYDLPGLPPQVLMAVPNQVKKALTPMEEEFSSQPSATVEIDGMTLTFPEVQARRTLTEISHSYLLPAGPSQVEDGAAPSPIIDPGPNRRATFIMHKSQPSQVASIKALSEIAEQITDDMPLPPAVILKEDCRVSQWLDHESTESIGRPRECSISTVKSNLSSSTTLSFAEHRRKRFEFYQLNTDIETRPQTPDDSPRSFNSQPPTPIRIYKVSPIATAVAGVPVRFSSKSFKSRTQHGRTNTDSTLASSVVSNEIFDIEEQDDAVSVTTYSGAGSRTGTVKSCASRTAPPAYIDTEQTVKSQTRTAVRSTSTDFVASPPKPMMMSPGSQAADVEKLMHDLCHRAGYRRVNVGVAF